MNLTETELLERQVGQEQIPLGPSEAETSYRKEAAEIAKFANNSPEFAKLLVLAGGSILIFLVSILILLSKSNEGNPSFRDTEQGFLFEKFRMVITNSSNVAELRTIYDLMANPVDKAEFQDRVQMIINSLERDYEKYKQINNPLSYPKIELVFKGNGNYNFYRIDIQLFFNSSGEIKVELIGGSIPNITHQDGVSLKDQLELIFNTAYLFYPETRLELTDIRSYENTINIPLDNEAKARWLSINETFFTVSRKTNIEDINLTINLRKDGTKHHIVINVNDGNIPLVAIEKGENSFVLDGFVLTEKSNKTLYDALNKEWNIVMNQNSIPQTNIVPAYRNDILRSGEVQTIEELKYYIKNIMKKNSSLKIVIQEDFNQIMVEKRDSDYVFNINRSSIFVTDDGSYDADFETRLNNLDLSRIASLILEPTIIPNTFANSIFSKDAAARLKLSESLLSYMKDLGYNFSGDGQLEILQFDLYRSDDMYYINFVTNFNPHIFSFTINHFPENPGSSYFLGTTDSFGSNNQKITQPYVSGLGGVVIEQLVEAGVLPTVNSIK